MINKVMPNLDKPIRNKETKLPAAYLEESETDYHVIALQLPNMEWDITYLHTEDVPKNFENRPETIKLYMFCDVIDDRYIAFSSKNEGYFRDDYQFIREIEVEV